MDATRDPAIKLFGMTIPLRPGVEAPVDDGGDGETDKDVREASHESMDQNDGPPNSQEGEAGQACVNQQDPRPVDEEGESTSNPPKKSAKTLPCPRCNSSDTKFCYFNNYSANQPRHFCKKCQRYWTAGGVMRDVPVGAGRRKSKSSHQMAILPDLQPDVLLNHSRLKPSGTTVLSFSSISNPAKQKENCDEHSSSGSSVTASICTDGGNGADHQEPAIGNHQEIAPQLPYLTGFPWPYPYPTSALYNPSFPVPVYPAAANWGFAFAIPWFPPLVSSCPNSGSPGPNSPTLGKHPREQDVLKHKDSESGETPKESKQEGCLWVPKTLRIGDPKEAAKSSTWAATGFKNEMPSRIANRGMFRAYQAKTDIKNRRAEGSFSVLHANPAALSRSLNFQESS